MSITTVFFDVGNTLLTPAIAESEVIVQAAASLGAQVDPALVEQSMPLMYARYEELYEADDSFWADEGRASGIWVDLYEYLCGLLGIPELGPEVARIGYERFLDPDSWTLFDDVIPTLFALKSRRVSIGLISNWDHSLTSIIEGMGIRFYFDVVLASADVGLHKPQPEIFRLALHETEAFASETIHVGDHLQADVGGATAAGINPVLIDRDDRHPDGEGYIRITNLRDLIKHL
ncbi:MAG: HAD family hydrolase [Coriobacteriales bacterium]|jgi:putative hydrolase of the HAD superfamily|nr:HAD family hydrolase [Coriobacteriales bacterium]